MTTPSAPSSSAPPLRLDRQAVADFLDAAFPAAARPAFGDLVLVEPGHVRMRLDPTADMIRPGDIVSGPTLMGLVDVAAYALVLAHIGPVAMAVTNSLNISFLRACQRAPIMADAHVLKLGRRLATLEVRLWQEPDHRLVVQATVGYPLP